MSLHTRLDTTFVADAATGVEDFYTLKQIQTVINPRFYPLLCQRVRALGRLLRMMTFKDL